MTKYTGKKDVVMVLEGTIMENTHGYKPLSWELIKLLSQGPPDFAGAEKLIHQGADVNDQGEDKEENVLSRIMFVARCCPGRRQTPPWPAQFLS